MGARRRPISGSAKAIARVIAEEHPHLVGLQQADRAADEPGGADHAYDFLQLLLDELRREEPCMEAAAVNTHFSAFLLISGTEGVRWTQRIAIIAWTDPRTRCSW